MACALEPLVGHVVTCPREACPFWEPGGAALTGGCVFERVGVHETASADPDRLLQLLSERLQEED